MSATVSHDDFLSQDSDEDDSSLEANTGQPLSQSEIEDLLYGGDRSTTERLELLRSLRNDMSARESNDRGEDDPAAVIKEIDDRIRELQAAEIEPATGGQLDFDSLAHRETLAPDSDELEELEDADAASLMEEDAEWEEPGDDPEALARPEEDEP